MNSKLITLVLLFVAITALIAQDAAVKNKPFDDKFKQLEELLPTPNDYRTASGTPGHAYWQQQVDYKMNLRLEDETQKLYGEEVITYHNNSPDVLTYLWLQLDQNNFKEDSDANRIRKSSITEKMSPNDLKAFENTYDGGFKIDFVQDANGNNLPFVINGTMMRVDIPKPLASKGTYTFKIKWWYNVNDRMKVGGRSGYEHFDGEDNYLYTLAQFYPRMAAYYDVYGWQNKQFLGAGEFTLDFGNYEVSITSAADHVVGATGVLQNADKVLTAEQRRRFEAAKSATEPLMIVSEAEAREAEKTKSKDTKTWVFKAENVRDFAFVSSRKFIWDAMGVQLGTKNVMAMSYYPKEGNPLWEKYSTKVVAHTIKWYSHYTFDYPYPVAISVHTDRIGMEYPMMCFNGGRPDADGTYSERTKYGMIGVIIHEVGHNYFPMIVNSDERQWTWMDEGLNTFLQYLTEQQFERGYPSWRGPAANIADYMKGDPAKLEPIMTNSESLHQFGNNAYGKPATALNILRETVMGRELFDFAFKQYAQKWMFKRPTPADFFRTMEDASAVDLDWFWRGWFYSTDYVDIALAGVKTYRVDSKNPEVELARNQERDSKQLKGISDIRNKELIPRTQDEIDRSLRDFYTDDNLYSASTLDKTEFDAFLKGLSAEDRALYQKNIGMNFYEVTFELKGELVMPVIVELAYTDGTKDVKYIPAEIWRMGDTKVSKVFRSEKTLVQVTLDPFLETADTNTENNYYPPRPQESKFEVFKSRGSGGPENPMQRAKRANAGGGGSN